VCCPSVPRGHYPTSKQKDAAEKTKVGVKVSEEEKLICHYIIFSLKIGVWVTVMPVA